ncbi:MAG: ATP-dependent DNA helicase RecG [bacterium]
MNSTKIDMDSCDLGVPIKFLPAVGIKTAEKFLKLGIESIGDLIFNYPRRYDDFTQITPIGQIPTLIGSNWQDKPIITIRGSLLGIGNKKTRKRGFDVTEAVVADDSASIKIVWFNQPFLTKMLRNGTELILHGRVTFNRFANELVMESPERASRLRIVPKYSETGGISSHYIEKIVSNLRSPISKLTDFLPSQILDKHKFLSLPEAIWMIHQPENEEKLTLARRRLAFEELFLISLRGNIGRIESQKDRAKPIVIDRTEIDKLIKQLPFVLTDDQVKATKEILADIAREIPMNRLLNGDVGSGKTIVAAIAALAAVRAGMKTLVMCPTSILAFQHYETFKEVFSESNLKISLLTSGRQESNYEIEPKSDKKTDSQNSKFKIQNSDVIIGTQALIQKGVIFDNVGLVIVDEQHRFGVKQRESLQKFSNNDHQLPTTNCEPLTTNCQLLKPHFLSMTATPIPRTLHLALFGELDFSVISQKPADRKEIKTRFVESQNRSKAYDFIRAHIRAGRQVFVICPLIEEKEDDKIAINLFEEDRKSVVKEYEKLKNEIFPEYEIGMLHGKMKAKEKDEIMAKFADGETQILVSTSVVEVGVNVPNATVMMIEDAEHFGLAQIHQFRGRVGRAEHQSFCLLFSNTQSEVALQRLKSLEAVADGFKLAEIDLETRGPGVIFGTEQSGMLDLKMASLSDRVLIEEASASAKEIAPEIDKYPLLKDKISQFVSSKHME